MCADNSTNIKNKNKNKTPRNTLLTKDLSNCETPLSLWTCPTAEHPTQNGPAPPQNTLLKMDLPHRGTPYSPWACPIAERLLFFYSLHFYPGQKLYILPKYPKMHFTFYLKHLKYPFWTPISETESETG